MFMYSKDKQSSIKNLKQLAKYFLFKKYLKIAVFLGF